MTCDEFEQLLADAWGGELATDQRDAFDHHAASCASCRTKFDEGVRALDAMRSLEGPRKVATQREGGRLVIQLPELTRPEPERRSSMGAFRLAASILIAFTAGYALHAGLMLRNAAHDAQPGPSQTLVSIGESGDKTSPNNVGQESISGAPSQTLRSAVVSAYRRGHGGSNLVRCLTVLSQPGA